MVTIGLKYHVDDIQARIRMAVSGQSELINHGHVLFISSKAQALLSAPKVTPRQNLWYF